VWQDMNFGFYVSGGAGRLKKCYQGGFAPAGVNCVVHDGPFDRDLQCVLNDNGVCYFHYDSGLRIEMSLSDYLYERLAELRVDYCFCFGSRILSGRLLDVYRNRIVNFHPSLLPAYPGLRAIDQALDSGALLIGNTAHFIDEGVDTGPMIMQSFITRSEYGGYDSVLDMQLRMLRQIASWLAGGRLSVEGRSVHIQGAHYGVGNFIPSIESEILQL
jgi:phosphoribosylglycinamide formyltransferase-1